MPWLTWTTHTDIGTLYFHLNIRSRLISALLSLLIRMRFAQQNSLRDKKFYIIWHTTYTLLIIFFLVTPTLFERFGGWLIPLILMCPDTAFPWIIGESLRLLPPPLIPPVFFPTIEWQINIRGAVYPTLTNSAYPASLLADPDPTWAEGLTNHSLNEDPAIRLLVFNCDIPKLCLNILEEGVMDFNYGNARPLVQCLGPNIYVLTHHLVSWIINARGPFVGSVIPNLDHIFKLDKSFYSLEVDSIKRVLEILTVKGPDLLFFLFNPVALSNEALDCLHLVRVPLHTTNSEVFIFRGNMFWTITSDGPVIKHITGGPRLSSIL